MTHHPYNPPVANSLSRHRVTESWDVRFNGHLYHVEVTRSASYADNWNIYAIRNAPNGGQYDQYLNDNSKLKLTIIKWVNQQLLAQQLIPRLEQQQPNEIR